MSKNKNLESIIKDIEAQIKATKSEGIKLALSQRKEELTKKASEKATYFLDRADAFIEGSINESRRLGALQKLHNSRIKAIDAAKQEFLKTGDSEVLSDAFDKLPNVFTYKNVDGRKVTNRI